MLQIQTIGGDTVNIEAGDIRLIKFMGAYWLIELANGKTHQIEDNTFMRIIRVDDETERTSGPIGAGDDTREL